MVSGDKCTPVRSIYRRKIWPKEGPNGQPWHGIYAVVESAMRVGEWVRIRHRRLGSLGLLRYKQQTSAGWSLPSKQEWPLPPCAMAAPIKVLSGDVLLPVIFSKRNRTGDCAENLHHLDGRYPDCLDDLS